MAQDLGRSRLQTRAGSLVQVVWTRGALLELRAIEDYVRAFSPLAAQRLGLKLLNAGQSLQELPLRGRPISHDRRELAIIWPYLIRYRVDGERAVILEIRHGAREPE